MKANFPERRGVGSDDVDVDSGIACDAEEFPVGEVLERPGAFRSPGWDPLWRVIGIRWRDDVAGDRTFWLSSLLIR